jgi:hypothetical protein
MTEKQREVAETFFKNSEKLSFGRASVELKIYAGKCVGITYTTSENIRQQERGNNYGEAGRKSKV